MNVDRHFGNSPSERRACFRRLFGGFGECIHPEHDADVLPDGLWAWIQRTPPDKLILRALPLGGGGAGGRIDPLADVEAFIEAGLDARFHAALALLKGERP